MKKIILGLDPGIADTGFGLISVEKDKLECLDFGSIKTSSQQELPDRLEKLNDELQKIIDKYQPSLVSIERLFFNTNAKTALIVGQARGVILLNVKKNGLKLLELTPLQIKQGVCNFGRADKKQVKKMVQLILNLKEAPKSDDAADALAAAICASNLKTF
ncbi:MAG: crossover junction endodeoxyribonuclease RuvC [Patescibacteria group bacterium]|jgi:crossover junction endodeoxyribonuclease RuvC